MSRWLLGKDKPITEPAIELLNEEETTCTPTGQVMQLKDARSTYDINREYEKSLAEHRRELWANTEQAELLKQVKRLAGIRRVADLPLPDIYDTGTLKRPGYKIDKLIFKPERGIYLPALMFLPEKTSSKNAVLYLHEDGKAAHAAPGGPIEDLVKAGHVVLAVDLRGIGQTQQKKQKYFASHFGSDGQDVYTAYLLGRSYVGMRAEDILICARFLRDYAKNMDLIALGSVGVPALHAAATEPRFQSVKLIRSLISFSNIIESGRSSNQLVNTVHAALGTYDLDNLSATLGARLTIEQPTDALGKIIDVEKN